jgi:hypothetical protein
VTPNDERKSMAVRATNAWDVLIVFIRSKLALVIAIVLAIVVLSLLGMTDILQPIVDLIKGL